jgi:hypothetical protein
MPDGPSWASKKESSDVGGLLRKPRYSVERAPGIGERRVRDKVLFGLFEGRERAPGDRLYSVRPTNGMGVRVFLTDAYELNSTIARRNVGADSKKSFIPRVSDVLCSRYVTQSSRLGPGDTTLKKSLAIRCSRLNPKIWQSHEMALGV